MNAATLRRLSSTLALRAVRRPIPTRIFSTRPASQLHGVPREDSLLPPLANGALKDPDGKVQHNVKQFNGIVRDGGRGWKMGDLAAGSCVHADGSAPGHRVDERYTREHVAAKKARDAQGAVDVLTRIGEEGLLPTADIFLCTVTLCVRLKKLDLAEDLLESHQPYVGNFHASKDVLRRARISVALGHLSCSRPKHALTIMGWSTKKPTVDARIAAMDLGMCEDSWVCLVRVLTCVDVNAALEVVELWTTRGVPFSARMHFNTLEALRECQNWRDAYALLSLTPHVPDAWQERTVGSVLQCMTANPVRRFVDPKLVSELVTSIRHPSPRFRRDALGYLCDMGLVKEARAVVDSMTEGNAMPDERDYSMLISAYSELVYRGAPDDCEDVEGWFDAVCDEVDELWERYPVPLHSRTSLKSQHRHIRSHAFGSVLYAKSHANRVAECAAALDDACTGPVSKRALDIREYYFASVLSGAEQAGDAESMRRVLEVMQREDLPHDLRSLAFVVGTALADGDAHFAFMVVTDEVPKLLDGRIEKRHKSRLKIFIDKLEMLVRAIEDGDLKGGSCKYRTAR